MPAPRFIPLADLHEDPANVRKHGDRNKASVRASILEFGQVETLVVQRATGRVLGGNCRLGELRALGREGAWCMEVDVEGIDATRLALALNRTAELAEWDADALGRLLSDLAPEDLGDLWTTEEVGAMAPPAADEWGATFGGLPQEDRQPFQQMTFTVADAQVDLVKRALTRAGQDGCKSALNDNSNGNALAALAAAYLGEEAP